MVCKKTNRCLMALSKVWDKMHYLDGRSGKVLCIFWIYKQSIDQGYQCCHSEEKLLAYTYALLIHWDYFWIDLQCRAGVAFHQGFRSTGFDRESDATADAHHRNAMQIKTRHEDYCIEQCMWVIISKNLLIPQSFALIPVHWTAISSSQHQEINESQQKKGLWRSL